MKKNRLLPVAALSVMSVWFLSGCSAALQSVATANDGMYGVHDKVQIANRQREAAELRRAEAEARKAELEARIAEAQVRALEDGYYDYPQESMTYSSVLADTYESAYMRRLRGFNSPSYRMPSSYYNLRYGGSFNYVTAYDPAFYNIMVSGDQVWVEPKYISSMFGTWGAANVTFGLSVYPYGWYYGWNRPYYGSWWGYPYYSWYDRPWGYNPWWGYGPNWHYGWNHSWGHVGGGPRPPYVNAPRPHRETIVNRPSTRYPSPSSGGVRPGSNSGGRGTVNGSGVYRPGGQNNGGTSGSRPSNNGTRNNSGSGSYNNNSSRGGSSSFFNNGGSSRSNGGGSYGGGSSSGSRGGSSSSSGGSGRGNGIGR